MVRQGACLGLGRLFRVTAVFVALLFSPSLSAADELLRIDGRAIRWAPPLAGPTTVITYAALTRSFTLPENKKTLSPDNCGAMGPFSEIVAGSEQLTGTAAMNELRSAFVSWERVASVRFVEVGDDQRADIVVGAITRSSGPAFANLSLLGQHGVLPVTKALGAVRGNIARAARPRWQRSPIATIERAYVCLNPKHRWKVGFDGNLDVYDLRHTFMHEIGHAIGLDHPGSSGAIMGYRYDEQAYGLQPSDIASAQALYGCPQQPECLSAPRLPCTQNVSCVLKVGAGVSGVTVAAE
jgi:Matrixin